jgi:nitrite reductase/ring-hydroxylating ferredoxin subunit/DMSO/TMAO reductase YedYZ heme-binding membrane subunit
MSVGFQAIQWNRAKYVYDAILIAGVIIYLIGFMWIASSIHPPKSLPEQIDLRIRALGTCAFLMLTIILSIGPLARLNPRFLPLLYNRRHFGVLFFLVACAHALSMLQWFAVQGAIPSLIDEFTAWENYLKFIGFPFKTLGLAALAIFFLMAATSHDYWLAFLKPPVWKALHMLVYVAYGLIVLHVALGIMQRDHSPWIPVMLGASLLWLSVLHVIAGWRERWRDHGEPVASDGWLPAGPPQSIPDKRAKIVTARGGERIAVYRDGNQVGALSNLCAHQNGPIGEGCIIDGLVTCPWHGYQYRLADGCAPPPFTERLVTYRVRLHNGEIEVDPRPLPPGTSAAITIPALAM